MQTNQSSLEIYPMEEKEVETNEITDLDPDKSLNNRQETGDALQDLKENIEKKDFCGWYKQRKI